MNHTLNSIFSRVCKWCGKEKFELPAQILICPQCDYANEQTIYPNKGKEMS